MSNETNDIMVILWDTSLCIQYRITWKISIDVWDIPWGEIRPKGMGLIVPWDISDDINDRTMEVTTDARVIRTGMLSIPSDDPCDISPTRCTCYTCHGMYHGMSCRVNVVQTTAHGSSLVILLEDPQDLKNTHLTHIPCVSPSA